MTKHVREKLANLLMLWNMPVSPWWNRRTQETVMNVVIVKAEKSAVNKVDSGSHRQLVIMQLVCMITTFQVIGSGYQRQSHGHITRWKLLPHECAQWIWELSRQHDLFEETVTNAHAFELLGASAHGNTRTCDVQRHQFELIGMSD